MFFTSKFSYSHFCNLSHKTETGTTNRWGTTSSKPPGPIITKGQSETLSSSQITIAVCLPFSFQLRHRSWVVVVSTSYSSLSCLDLCQQFSITPSIVYTLAGVNQQPSVHQFRMRLFKCFGDEPKHIQVGRFYFSLPLPRVFSALFSAPKFSPSYLLTPSPNFKFIFSSKFSFFLLTSIARAWRRV
jgi:hypothetical protein